MGAAQMRQRPCMHRWAIEKKPCQIAARLWELSTGSALELTGLYILGKSLHKHEAAHLLRGSHVILLLIDGPAKRMQGFLLRLLHLVGQSLQTGHIIRFVQGLTPLHR